MKTLDKKEALKELVTSEQFYDIIVALRGPDFSFTRERIGEPGRIDDGTKTRRLKALTTQRIRSVVGMPDYQAHALTHSTPLSQGERIERDALL